MNKIQKIKVAISMVTYNHDKYIGQAINGVLNQKTDFDFVLILTNDCSSDNTHKICLKFSEKFPKQIIYEDFEKNKGMIENWKYNLTKCLEFKPNFIAICEGDDFWIDSLKLQKQVDFLENNYDCSLCFHNANVFNLNDNSEKLFRTSTKNRYETKDVILNKWFCPTASIVLKKEILGKNSVFWVEKKNIVNLDQLLLLSASLKGTICYLDQVMSVYRYGVLGSASNQYNSIISRSKNYLNYLSHINKITKNKYLLYILVKKIYVLLSILKNTLFKK